MIIRPKKIQIFLFFVLLFPNSIFAMEPFPYTLGGEVRGSFQYIRERGTDYTNQQVQNLGAILGIEAEPMDEFTLGFQVATGTTSPTSRFQTLGSSWNRKSIGVDLAFIRWKPETLEGFFFELGKVPLPFYRMMNSQLVFDRDLNPEGVSLGYSKTVRAVQLDFRAGHYIVEERVSSSDTHLSGAQVLSKFDLEEKQWGLTIGASYYPYRNIKNRNFLASGSSSRGNSTIGNSTYSEEYRLAESFFESTYLLGKLPLTAGFHLLKNFAASTKENLGWLGAIRLGGIKSKGDWESQLTYRSLDKDAAIAAFVESDFAGGATNSKGYDARFTYAIRKNLRTMFAYFDTFENKSGAESSYKRYRLDLILNF